MTDNLVVQAAGLTKYYGPQRGLEDLDLEVYAGEVFGFLGPNGAGKTTTIRLMLDFIRPTRGWVRVLGADPRGQGVAIRRRIGYLPGELRFDGRDRVDQLLRFLGDARGGVPKKRVTELAERFELDTTRKIRTLSKGNKQKVGLVQAFMHDPELLVLDEPANGLDPAGVYWLRSFLRRFAEQGRTVLLASHMLAEIGQTVDQVVIINRGRRIASGRIDELTRGGKTLEDTYLELTTVRESS